MDKETGKSFWDLIKERAGNPFIVLFLIAFFLFNRAQIYELLYTPNVITGKNILSGLDIFEWRFLFYVLTTFLLYYISVGLGELVDLGKNLLVGEMRKRFANVAYITASERTILLGKIGELEKQVKTAQGAVESKMQFHIGAEASLAKLAGFDTDKIKPIVAAANLTQKYVPFVYDLSSNEVVEAKRVFETIQSYERIRFKVSNLAGDSALYLEINGDVKELNNVPVGIYNYYVQFTKLQHDINGVVGLKWSDNVYFTPKSHLWSVDWDNSPNAYLRLNLQNNLVLLSARFPTNIFK